MDAIRRTVEYCTQMDTPPRTPYVGDLVYTSFSGSHQDAIKKGFAARAVKVAAAGGDENAVPWELPYLPIDPHDVGRSYEAVVRVNSQSGKGGVAYLMSTAHSLELPRRLQVEFSRIVQRHTDTYGGEVDADTLWAVFADEYLPTSAAPGLQPWGRFELRSSQVGTIDDEHVELTTVLIDSGAPVTVNAKGTGPIDAFVSALHEFDLDVRILDYSEHAMSQGRRLRGGRHRRPDRVGGRHRLVHLPRLVQGRHLRRQQGAALTGGATTAHWRPCLCGRRIHDAGQRERRCRRGDARR